ncbi:winged helix DNA-binding protein [Pararhodobacter zhoushanensis]|uniref:Winged helix DNA-binding protein n=1 Tax=Pararhodobacter zhoushanensis TaxID=2479545 RepID=A0ABT3H2F6_9RHOB|nr:winged helix DNA-binding protein [Pararhodobacter zhoushanensis]MCW1404388.1 winged helix DNA-binding protein [Novosphingobium sp. MW5]MCW1933979.1 winged helix DNA-binding protein [Pararhodobacter zhoushanensis]
MTHPLGPVVSSAHLAGDAPALSELEFALTMANHAFQRWIVRCMGAAGAQLSPMEVLILHQVAHRDRAKTLADLCLVLNIEDTHLANYAIRKLTAQGLVSTERKGKEKAVRVTPEGAALCQRYAEIRASLLNPGALQTEAMSELAALLRTLSGSYDQAARAAAAL